MSLLPLIQKGASLAELSAAADALGPEKLLGVLDALDARALKQLYELAGTATAPASTAFLVPTGTPQGHTVVWHGRNNLPVFTRFQKRFYAGPAQAPGALTGHNKNGGFATFFVGPGYFEVSVRADRPAELYFDYTRYPTASPPGWPAVSSNRRGIAFLAFGTIHDFLRPVGHYLGIGATHRNGTGKLAGQYFSLVRGETIAPAGSSRG